MSLKPKPLNAEQCPYRCPYFMDGPVLSPNVEKLQTAPNPA